MNRDLVAIRHFPADDVYVAFLRAINVGGNNMVSMKSLKTGFERLGYRDVATYINSGNVLFRAAAGTGPALERAIDAMLAREFGVAGKTVVRSHAEMARLVKRIRRAWKHADPAMRNNVMFLRRAVDSHACLDGVKLQPGVDHVVYCPGTLLWSVPVSASSRSAMVKLSSARIYQEMTVRNLNTTMKVFELMERMCASRS